MSVICPSEGGNVSTPEAQQETAEAPSVRLQFTPSTDFGRELRCWPCTPDGRWRLREPEDLADATHFKICGYLDCVQVDAGAGLSEILSKTCSVLAGRLHTIEDTSTPGVWAEEIHAWIQALTGRTS